MRGGKTETSFPRCGLALLLLGVGLVVLLAGVPAKAAQVTLAWDRNTESNIAGYRIYYGNGSRAYNWFIDVGNVLTHTVSGLTDGSTYYFAAKAYNTSNVESAYSAEVSYRACTYSISPTTASIGQQGTSGTLKVTTQAGCSWTANSGASWFTITSGYQGTGNGTVAYSVTSNTGASPRTVASTIARKLFTVTQAGTGSANTRVTLGATYSTDVRSGGTKYYHNGNDWVGRSSTGAVRTANRWDISGINPSWKIVSVEVRFYAEAKTGSTGALSINRYGSSHGQDNPQTDSGTLVYSKSAGSAYASLPEPSSGSWTNWVNLGSTAVSDIVWCRNNGKTTWSVGLKASSTVESSTTVRHIDFSEDNEANDAELRITYM